MTIGRIVNKSPMKISHWWFSAQGYGVHFTCSLKVQKIGWKLRFKWKLQTCWEAINVLVKGVWIPSKSRQFQIHPENQSDSPEDKSKSHPIPWIRVALIWSIREDFLKTLSLKAHKNQFDQITFDVLVYIGIGKGIEPKTIQTCLFFIQNPLHKINIARCIAQRTQGRNI